MAKKGKNKRWDPRRAEKAAEAERAELIRLMRGSTFSIGHTVEILKRTYDEAVSSGVSPEDELRNMRDCFAVEATGPDPRLIRLAQAIVDTEIARLADAPLYVLEPAALDDLEAAVYDNTSQSPPAQLPKDDESEGGYLVLPRPVYTRAANGALAAVRALLWAPQTPRLGDDNSAPGTRVSIYHDPVALRRAYQLDALEEIARQMTPATKVPPLLFMRGEFYRSQDWEELIAKQSASAAAIPAPDSRPVVDAVPPGADVFDDPHQVIHLKLLRAFSEYCAGEQLERRTRTLGQDRRTGVRTAPPTSVVYVPKRTIVWVEPEKVEPDSAEPETADAAEATAPGATYTPRGDAKREFTRRTRAWPVNPVVRKELDPATGQIQATVVRRPYVQGPDRVHHTYEELAAKRAEARQKQTRAVRATPDSERQSGRSR